MSALKPQGTPPSPQLSKPMHPQTSPASYNQSTTHMPQTLINLPHGNTNPAHQTNHYPLNANANQHYTSSTPIPASNHPVASGGQIYSPNKPQQQFSTGYQPNIVQHPPTNQANNPVPAPVPPVSQALRATVETKHEKPQSNGTSEVKTPEKQEEPPKETKENHIASEPEPKKPEPVVSETETPNSTPPSESETKEDKEVTETPTKEPEPEKEETTTEESAESREETPSPPKVKEVEKKVATPVKASPRTPRKSKTPKSESESPKKPEPKTPPVAKSASSSSGKSKRNRTRTQPYQIPLPEIEIITKITSAAPKTKSNDDKLIVFYKNEFLAVRNSEGSFYVCQAVQNIYKTSPKIRIRWLSQEKSDKNGETYTPDFYDHTDFDCILTNLKLERVDKGRFRLPPLEKERTDSILKRSLAVEKGEVTSPSLTEEHPDGIDVSLYKEESQLKKRRGPKRRATSTPRKAPKRNAAKVRKVEPKPKATPVPKKKPEKPAVPEPVPSTSRTDRARRRDNQNSKVSPVIDQKKAKVLAKVARKTTKNAKIAPPPPKKSPPKPAAAATRKTKRTRK